MNVFKRMGDIISSNVNSMLDRMEDPKKMINLMITEMEETEREIRMSIAEKSAENESIKRNLESVNAQTARWAERAELAVDNGNDDLAREAIIERKKSAETAALLEKNIATLENIIVSLKEQLGEVSAKLTEMKAKRTELVERAAAAKNKMKVNETLREADSVRYAKRFEELQARIEKWEAEAKVFSGGTQVKTTGESFEEMELSRDVEAELSALKNRNREIQ
ncbi:MAG: PspA/IM30 family protein [Bullifex sp.]